MKKKTLTKHPVVEDGRSDDNNNSIVYSDTNAHQISQSLNQDKYSFPFGTPIPTSASKSNPSTNQNTAES